MFQVQKKQCATCIYGRNSASCASVAVLEAEVADPNMPGFFRTSRRCHNSDTACCSGFWNRHKNDFAVGQVAQRLQLVELVDHVKHP